MLKNLRGLIVSAFERGERQVDIVRRFKDDGVSRQFVSYTIKRWRETRSIADRPRSGRPRTARIRNAVRKIGMRIRRNRRRSHRKLAAALGTSRSTIRRILEFDLGLKAYKRRKVHGLSIAQKKQRRIRCNRLLRRCASYRMNSIVFSDEKLFTVEEKLNKQNDRIYAVAFEAIPEKFRTVQRFQSRSSIMVWGAVSGQGKFPLVIIDKGVKVNQTYYQRAILERVVKPTAQKMFKNGQWTFQQDSAPAHSAKNTQAFCTTHFPDFIKSSDWPSSSPDLNVMDYAIWGILEARVNATNHRSLDSLKRALQREWKKLSMNQIRTAVGSWRRRLKACVDANGGRFE
jgi:transposase